MKTKTCEMDPIPTKLLKEILPSVIEPITNLVNTSLQQGIFSKPLEGHGNQTNYCRK